MSPTRTNTCSEYNRVRACVHAFGNRKINKELKKRDHFHNFWFVWHGDNFWKPKMKRVDQSQKAIKRKLLLLAFKEMNAFNDGRANDARPQSVRLSKITKRNGIRGRRLNCEGMGFIRN